MSTTAGGRVRTRIRVEGIVQGVGFRPFVHALATRHELGGLVGNDAEGVFIEAEGDDEAALAAFLEALDTEAPPLAVVESLSCDRVAALDGTLEVDSPPGRGTRLTVRIPVPAEMSA